VYSPEAGVSFGVSRPTTLRSGLDITDSSPIRPDF
jgi:hypothetical protein